MVDLDVKPALMGPAIVGPTLLVQQDLHLTAGHLAWFQGGMAAGMLLGSLWIARRGARASATNLLLVGMILDGITYLPFYWIPSYALFLGAIVVHGLFIPWIVVGRTSLAQTTVPSAQQGKVFALIGLTVSGMTALSAAGAGLLASWVGARGLFLTAGVFASLVGLVGFVTPRRRFLAAETGARPA